MVLLISLGLMVSTIEKQELGNEIVATIEERPEESLNQVLEQDVTPSKTLDVVSAAISPAGAMGVMSVSVAPQMRQDNNAPVPTEVKADPGQLNIFNTTGKQVATDIPQGSFGDAMQQAESYQDAMDRITHEILTKLTHGNVLVLWCMDQSESMKDDHAEIMKRIERVYEELGISEKGRGDALLTAVTSFGKEHKLHTPKPTSDRAQIISAMKQVPVDPSGQEQMCEAISYAVGYHYKFATSGRRQLMCVVVTDESGDPESNWKQMEQTIQECKQARCPVYFLAREAVFGYPYAHMRYIDPETKTHHWLRIDRGPETPYAEQLQIDGFIRRHDAHPSGFGPYSQTRIARQTGGIFFMLPSPEVNLVRRDDRKYAFESMRPYLPDLSSRDDYAKERDRYEMRKSLWKVILDLNPYEKGRDREVQVRWWEWSVEPATFVAQAKEEYTRAQKLIGYMAAAQKELERVKPGRQREESFRWRANYDLMYAQMIAYQVRLHEYCASVEEMGRNYKPPKDPKANEWHCYTIAKTKTDAKTKPQRDKAIELLKQVIKDHEGTPYAARAQYEIARGFGLELRAVYDDPRRKNVKLPSL
ncbi:MAG TPA: vWA domain-containing protein [Pirellulales bacterium]|nr:vWA domain-containing protein [Pirellulales bacterium]